jgi:hypothetical protein
MRSTHQGSHLRPPAATNTCPLLLLPELARHRTRGRGRPRARPLPRPALVGPLLRLRQLARARSWTRRSPTAALELADRRGRGRSSGEPGRWELVPGAAAHQARSSLLVKCIAGERNPFLPLLSPLSSRGKMPAHLSCSGGTSISSAQYRGGGIYAFAYRCRSQIRV